MVCLNVCSSTPKFVWHTVIPQQIEANIELVKGHLETAPVYLGIISRLSQICPACLLTTMWLDVLSGPVAIALAFGRTSADVLLQAWRPGSVACVRGRYASWLRFGEHYLQTYATVDSALGASACVVAMGIACDVLNDHTGRAPIGRLRGHHCHPGGVFAFAWSLGLRDQHGRGAEARSALPPIAHA